MKPRIYIAGPMRGKPLFNFPAFDQAKGELEALDWEVVSPAELDRAEGFDPADLPDDYDWAQFPESEMDFRKVVFRDLEALATCQAICMLCGWACSDGALTEYHFANWIGLQIVHWHRLHGPNDNTPKRAQSRTKGDWVLEDEDGNPIELRFEPGVWTRGTGEYASPLPTDAAARKSVPIFSGLIRYFPAALAAVAQVSHIGNEQHNPGEPLHWAKEKSTDETDALSRHLIEMGVDELHRDTDGVLTAAKVAWRALANLQRMADSGVDLLAAKKVG